MQKNKYAIFIVGPTAVGKTKISIDIAKKINTEIISCDSRQFYKELKIGSAPPSFQEQQEIRHHFIQHLSIKDDYNAGKFELDAINKIKELHKKYNKIILVGGSGLYIDAICKGFDNIPKISNEVRKKINLKYKENGIKWLQNEAMKIEPKIKEHPNFKNPQRLLRILEVFNQTGKRLSSFHSNKIKKRPFKIIKIGLKMSREDLYSKINNRVDVMIQNGLIDEVVSLSNYKHKNALNTVGYKELFYFIKHETTLEKTINEIKMNTRRFAKRQITWFKKDKEIQWFESHQTKEIIEFISKL
jgi:tRNA dimethylallyltransferase